VRFWAFTLTELLVVLLIMMVLAALALGLSHYMGARTALARAQADIRFISLALEAYKADNGRYPLNPLTFSTSSTTITYTENAGSNSIVLFRALFFNPRQLGREPYYTFKSDQLEQYSPNVSLQRVLDPWRRPYNYDSASDLGIRRNATFDLWSSGPDGLTSDRKRYNETPHYGKDPDNDDVTNFNE